MSNGRQIVRRRGAPPPVARQQSAPAPGTQDGNWMWDGCQWVCCDGDFDDCQPFPPCPPVPPPQFPPWFDPHNAPWYPGANAGVSFGSTTFPQFPIRGNFFWDGLRLWMFDGAAWVSIVDSAIAAGPPAPGIPGSGTGGSGGSGGSGAGSGQVVISSTPPGNPIKGEEWWNGSVLQMWDGAKWNIIGPQSFTGPVGTTTITFGMTATTNRAVPGSVAAWGIVPFNDIPNPDSLLGWDSVQHKYTPTKAGIYLFEIRGGGSPSGGIALLKNDPGSFANALASDIIVAIQSQNTGGWNSVAGIALMNGTTDFVRMWAWASDSIFHSTGSNITYSAAILP